jgi:hypothetical protein
MFQLSLNTNSQIGSYPVSFWSSREMGNPHRSLYNDSYHQLNHQPPMPSNKRWFRVEDLEEPFLDGHSPYLMGQGQSNMDQQRCFFEQPEEVQQPNFTWEFDENPPQGRELIFKDKKFSNFAAYSLYLRRYKAELWKIRHEPAIDDMLSFQTEVSPYNPFVENFNFATFAKSNKLSFPKCLTENEYIEMRQEFEMNGREVVDVDVDDVFEFPPLNELPDQEKSKLTGIFTSPAKPDEDVIQKPLVETVKTEINSTNIKKKSFCVFCINNNEPSEVFNSHILKDGNGKILCPILRKYTCPICGAKGENGESF